MEQNEEVGLETPLLQDSGSASLNHSQDGWKIKQNTRKLIFKIQGIECASCAVSIESMVGSMDGIENIDVSPLQGQAVIIYKPEITNARSIKEAIEDMGYQVDQFPEQVIEVCRLRIKGMACTSCSESVERALLMANGVKKAVVGLALEEAKIHFDPNLTDANHLIEAVEDAGFEADLISSGDDVNKVHLRVEGLQSSEDAILIQSSLKALEGVNHVQMDEEGQKITISYDPDFTGPRSLLRCIQEAARNPNQYRVSLYTPSRQRETERQLEIRGYRNQFLWSCLFSFPVFIFSMVLPMIPSYGGWLDGKVYNNLTIGLLLRWIFCTPVQFIIGWRFYIGTYHALRQVSANMDVLVAMGTNAAYFYSVYVAIKAFTSSSFEGQDFFETSAMLISFILLGKYLEVVAKGKTSDALAKLTELAPDTAVLLNFDADGKVLSEMEISTQLLQRNDVIKIVPGAKVPTDGIVVEGQSRVNESMITGEARAISKRPGDKVIGGTVNEYGCILVKATHVGSDTALSQIVQLVEAAQLSRAPVQRLADKISRIFVPTVVVAAFITWLCWFITGEVHLYPRSWIPKDMDGFELALQFGISVLVVACPCALGLATPTAVMVATGKGASQGVLIKGGNALENAHKVKAVIFDKTGTLTVGKPAVVNTMVFSNTPLLELCDLAAAAEANSEHPLAKAIVEYTKKLHEQYGIHTNHIVESRDFEVHPGAGVSAKVGDRTVLVGNKRLMLAFQVPVSPEVQAYVSDTEHLARTCVLVAVAGVLCGAFAVSDPLKPEAGRVVSFLSSMSILSIMVTGDNQATATAIANEVGISRVYAETDPVGKADRIKELQMKGLTVAVPKRSLRSETKTKTKNEKLKMENASTISKKWIFILSGQSNMSGRGGVHAGHWNGAVPTACHPCNSILRFTASSSWEEARDPLHFDIDATKTCGVGPGMPFATALLPRLPPGSTIALVPCAIGGTAIREWERGKKLYNEMVRRSKEAAGDGEIKAVLWYQGESDTSSEHAARSYKLNLERFIGDVRDDLQLHSLPFIQVALASGDKQHIEQVRKAQLGIDMPNVVCVDAKGLPLKEDHLHLCTEAQVKLGNMLAEAYINHFLSPNA